MVNKKNSFTLFDKEINSEEPKIGFIKRSFLKLHLLKSSPLD